MFQNYLIIMATLVFETQSSNFSRWVLTNQNLISSIFGIIIITIMNILIFAFLTTGFIIFSKISKGSNFYSIVEGLNMKSRCWSILYYIHYFSVRILIFILLFITPLASSVFLWGLLIPFQITYVFINMLKIYPELSNRIICVLTEILVFIVIIYCFACNFLKGKTDYEKQK